MITQEDFKAFLELYRKMRQAQTLEIRAQQDIEHFPMKSYNSIFYNRYVAEKNADKMCEEFLGRL